MVEILNETPHRLPLSALERALNALLDELGVRQTVTLVFCDDATIRRMNARDRGEDTATDVLSYPLWEPDDAMMPEVEQLGDVFVSVETAARQAPGHGHDLPEELLTLAAHGVTHLRGFDHPTEAAWQTFHHNQRRILALYRNRADERR